MNIKDLFKKKKLDFKFKAVGPGRRLNEASNHRGQSHLSRHQQPHAIPPRSNENQPAFQAALSRYETSQRVQNVNFAASAIKAQAAKVVEAGNPSAVVDSQPGSSTRSRNMEVPLSPPMVEGIYFTCEALGPDVDTYDKIMAKIEEYLYQQTEEEPVLASILMIHSLNEPTSVKSGVETLIRILKNIVDHPNEDKYRKIRLGSKTFQERIAPLTGAMTFLKAVGFYEIDLPPLNSTDPDPKLEPYLVFDKEDLNDFPSYIDALSSAEPLTPHLDRNTRVLAPALAATQLDLPDEFFNLTVEEVRREHAERKKQVELLTQMRTQQQRDKDDIKDPYKSYAYSVVRIKFPEDIILQGTFSARETVSDVMAFVQEHLQEPDKIFFSLKGPGGEQYDPKASLSSLKLVPAVLLNLHVEVGDKTYLLRPDVVQRLQQLPPAVTKPTPPSSPPASRKPEKAPSPPASRKAEKAAAILLKKPK